MRDRRQADSLRQDLVSLAELRHRQRDAGQAMSAAMVEAFAAARLLETGIARSMDDVGSNLRVLLVCWTKSSARRGRERRRHACPPTHWASDLDFSGGPYRTRTCDPLRVMRIWSVHDRSRTAATDP